MVGETQQTSGNTTNDFTNPITYRVIACDRTGQNYKVTVSGTGGSAKDITSYSFNNIPNVIYKGSFNGNNIYVTLPQGMDTTSLPATFVTSGHEVTVNNTTQTSGVTTNDFSSSSVTYIVHACDYTINTYAVTVLPAQPPNFLTFYIGSVPGKITMDDFPSGNNYIDITLPTGTDLTSLFPDFTIDGDHVEVGGVSQHSGIDAQDFTSQVIYTVFAVDSSYKEYIVTVTLE